MKCRWVTASTTLFEFYLYKNWFCRILWSNDIRESWPIVSDRVPVGLLPCSLDGFFYILLRIPNSNKTVIKNALIKLKTSNKYTQFLCIAVCGRIGRWMEVAVSNCGGDAQTLLLLVCEMTQHTVRNNGQHIFCLFFYSEKAKLIEQF